MTDDLQERMANVSALVQRTERELAKMKQEIAEERALLASKERRYNDLRRSLAQLQANAKRMAMSSLPAEVRGRSPLS